MTYSLGDIILLIILISVLVNIGFIYLYHSMAEQRYTKKKKKKNQETYIIVDDTIDDGR